MDGKPTTMDHLFARSVLRLLPQWMTPNHITIFRFFTIPFVLLLLVAEEYGWGTALFGISAFSDALDGALARTTGRITDWGKMFDPLADKLLIGSVAALVVTKHLGAPLAFFIIVIEIFLIANAYYKKKYKNIIVQAERTGKMKMMLQSVGVGMLLVYALAPLPWLLVSSAYILYFSLFFALWSLIVYKAI